MFRVLLILPIVVGVCTAAGAKLHTPSEAYPIDAEAMVDVSLYFAAGVVAPTFVCDSPRGVYARIPVCDVSWRETPTAQHP
jgi:hypothetical protein